MTAGQLDQRVSIERPTTVSDGAGGQTVTWSEVYSLWAKVSSVRGREEQHLGRTVTVETYLIDVRYGPTILTTDRVVWNGKTMNILSAMDRDLRRRRLTIEAEVGRGT